ncbi:type II toxin-antitoxin system VapC family toxin [Mycolicibacterium phlei]|uniref:type II toxin-antitoxin system VapC family toxin n=1 Tax=Mycolicibacterium phlei TaxID=1771 RepID=UPI0037CA31D1
MATIYLDSSVALRTILDVPERDSLQRWMDTPGLTFVSSRLLRTEVIRVLRREGLRLADAAPLLDRVGQFDVTREVHTIAESIERHVRTLDALHVATALLVGEPVTVATHDAAMRAVAEQVGLAVIDPVGATPASSGSP